MSHENFPGETRGSVQVSMAIVPEAEALNAPTGFGRQKPNTDPVLPPVRRSNRLEAPSVPRWVLAIGIGTIITLVTVVVILLVVVFVIVEGYGSS